MQTYSFFSDKVKDLSVYVALISLAVAVFVIWDNYIYEPEKEDELGSQTAKTEQLVQESEEASEENKKESDCNVIKTSLKGDLLTYMPESSGGMFGNGVSPDSSASEFIVWDVLNAEENEKIKAIVLEVDSYGGVPTAGEEVANALKNAKKPTVALIRDSGASAAYMAATGADTIFASKFSNVGGIGVTMSYLDSIEKNKKDGYVFNQLSVGKYKDMGNENKPLTQDEKNLFMRDLNINFDNFIKLVAENRKLDISFVRKLSDGSSMPGELALKNKLIDKIGGIREVEEHLKLLIGEEVEFCAYD